MKRLNPILNVIIAIYTGIVFYGCGDSLCKVGMDKYCDEGKQDSTYTGNIKIIWYDLSTHPELSTVRITVYRPSYEQTGEVQTLLGDLVVEETFPKEAREGLIEKIPADVDYIVVAQFLGPDNVVVYEGYEEGVAVKPMMNTVVGPIVTIRVIVPLEPLNLDVYVGPDEVTLTWDEAIDASGYMLYYDTDPGWPYDGSGANEGPSPIMIEGVIWEEWEVEESISFSLTGFNEGEVYYFSLTAYNDLGESNYSSEVSAVTIPGVPGDLTAVAGIGEIEISWEGVYGADGYMVYYDIDSVGSYEGTDAAEGLSPITIMMTNDIKLTDLTGSTTYYIVVAAFNASGEGYYSIEVAVTTL